MSTELFLTPENTTVESLHALFEAAMFETEIDKDGDLIVTDRYRVIVAPRNDSYIVFTSIFALKEDAPPVSCDAFCNRINDKLIAVRASNGENALILDWYLPIVGGIFKKTIVFALRKFTEIAVAIDKHDTDNLLG